MQKSRGSNDLSAVEVHDILSNERRQMVIHLLQTEGRKLSTRDLSERIAEAETGESPPPRNIRQSAYVSLHQTHLPKLAEHNIIHYDQNEKMVELDEETSQEVSIYMEQVPKYGISWSEYYLGVGTLGLLIIVAAQVGVPGLVGVDPLQWAIAVLALIISSATYQTIQQGSSLLHRLGAIGENDDSTSEQA